jgi:hypothetical protein
MFSLLPSRCKKSSVIRLVGVYLVPSPPRSVGERERERGETQTRLHSENKSPSLLPPHPAFGHLLCAHCAGEKGRFSSEKRTSMLPR